MTAYMFFGVWNIRGFMDPLKQAEIRCLIRSNNLYCIDILETKVSESHFLNVSSSLLSGWNWLANYNTSLRVRIWIGWDPLWVAFELHSNSIQVVCGYLHMRPLNKSCFLSIVYVEHTFVSRRPLRSNLVDLCVDLVHYPWLVLGDFNTIKDLSDRMGSSNVWIPSFDEFSQCFISSCS